MIKLSKFNYYIKDDTLFYVLNTLTGKIMCIPFCENDIDILQRFTNPNYISFLQENGIVLETGINEDRVLRYWINKEFYNEECLYINLILENIGCYDSKISLNNTETLDSFINIVFELSKMLSVQKIQMNICISDKINLAELYYVCDSIREYNMTHENIIQINLIASCLNHYKLASSILQHYWGSSGKEILEDVYSIIHKINEFNANLMICTCDFSSEKPLDLHVLIPLEYSAKFDDQQIAQNKNRYRIHTQYVIKKFEIAEYIDCLIKKYKKLDFKFKELNDLYYIVNTTERIESKGCKKTDRTLTMSLNGIVSCGSANFNLSDCVNPVVKLYELLNIEDDFNLCHECKECQFLPWCIRWFGCHNSYLNRDLLCNKELLSNIAQKVVCSWTGRSYPNN